MNEIRVGPLDSRYIAAAVALVQQSFDDALMPYLVYGQSGIGCYVSDLLPRVGVRQPREFWGAWDERDNLVGFADFDVRERTKAHLSYICVMSEARGRGVASRLIERFIRTHSDVDVLQLDVFDRNTEARDLYARRGFVESGYGSDWLTRELPVAREGSALTVHDLPSALAGLQRHGFAAITVRWHGADVRFGLLGYTVLRCFGAEEFRDDELLSSIRRVFPDTVSALLVAERGAFDPRACGGQRLLTSTRLSRSLNQHLAGGQP